MKHLDNERIQHYLDGALGEGERTQVEDHLAQCASCVQEMKAWGAVFTPLGSLPLLEPSRTFETDVLSRLGIQPWWTKLFSRPLWPKVALAGAMATLAGWIAFLSRYVPDLSAPQNATLVTLPAKVSRGAGGVLFDLARSVTAIPALIRDAAFYLKIGNTVWSGVNQPSVWGALFLLLALTLYLFRMASASGRAEQAAGLSVLNLRLYH